MTDDPIQAAAERLADELPFIGAFGDIVRIIVAAFREQRAEAAIVARIQQDDLEQASEAAEQASEAAEARCTRLEAALRQIEARDPECNCDHTDEDCCAKHLDQINGAFCARCFAYAALGEKG